MNTNQRFGRNADGTTNPGFRYVTPGRESGDTLSEIVRRAVVAVTSALSR